MSDDPFEAKSAAVETVRRQWQDRIMPSVSRAVADANAHAVQGLAAAVGKLRASPPQQVLRLANVQPALTRLNLWVDAMTGLDERSLRGEIRDARAAIYDEAAREWFGLIPAEYRAREGHEPTDDQRDMIRAARIHGLDPRRYVECAADDAVRSLRNAVLSAARLSAAGTLDTRPLERWRDETIQSLSRAVVTLLNDSAEYADVEAGRDLLRPELIDDGLSQSG